MGGSRGERMRWAGEVGGLQRRVGMGSLGWMVVFVEGLVEELLHGAGS